MGLGATAGLTLSPLPWKLLDDISIWTQNWPWIPVPKEGKISHAHTVCSLCPGGCGITVRKVDDRVIGIKGRDDFPTNRGGICALGLSGPQLLYTPIRIMTPMRKVDGAFNQITWPQALDFLSTKLTELRKQNKSGALACVSDSDSGTVPSLFKRFLAEFDSPNFLTPGSVETTWEVLTKRMFGSPFLPGYDLENTDLVLSFGCGLVEGWGSPVHSIRTRSQWKENKTKLIQIEPRLSNTAAVADQWISIKPGTEAELALGIIGTILKENLLKHISPQMSRSDLGLLKSFIQKNYSLEQVAHMTGLPQSHIKHLAIEFSQARRPLALCGKGQGRWAGNSREFAAISFLNLLTGNLEPSGGIRKLQIGESMEWPRSSIDPLSRQDSSSSAIGTPDISGSYKVPSIEAFFNTVVNSDKSQVQVLFINNLNPSYTLMNKTSVEKALDKIPLVVNFSPYWDDTAVNADLLLPNHSYLERYQDVPVYCGLNEPIVGLSRPVSKKIFDTRHTGSVIIQTAHSLGGNIKKAFPWKNYPHCLKSTIGSTWDNVLQSGFAHRSRSNQASLKLQKGFVELISEIKRTPFIIKYADTKKPILQPVRKS